MEFCPGDPPKSNATPVGWERRGIHRRGVHAGGGKAGFQVVREESRSPPGRIIRTSTVRAPSLARRAGLIGPFSTQGCAEIATQHRLARRRQPLTDTTKSC